MNIQRAPNFQRPLRNVGWEQVTGYLQVTSILARPNAKMSNLVKPQVPSSVTKNIITKLKSYQLHYEKSMTVFALVMTINALRRDFTEGQ